ncbi:transmembrane protein, putative [Bodo saltans]|uniref:Transmembrane protein, putative n=1 Tax=Bodo saltans TaxID=75058 RepID=A0A0S4IV31_BODSA|nr:transmembrane protein, putative [Bodo saltans]|eukprot:CUG15458.1 transmembrane protein, putative [Bodo saltans]
MSLLFLHDDFNSGLYACFDDQPSCMDGFFCPCCAVSAQYNMLKHRKAGVLAHVYLPLFILGFFTWGLALSCFSVVTRNMLRRGFLLSQESEASSCCKAFCCPHCSICQVYREMSMRHVWPDGVCSDAPYVKRGLVLPPPNPDRMGNPTPSSNNMREIQVHQQQQPPQQWQQNQFQHQPQPTQSRRESSLPVNGQPVFGYPVQAAPQHTSQQQQEQQQYPTKPVYGYTGGQPPIPQTYPLRQQVQQQPQQQPWPPKGAA